MKDLLLNYEWKVFYQGETKAEIRAIGTEWDMDRIHQDTMKMAECLQKNAQAIRDLKSKAFGRQNVEIKQLVNQQKYNDLVQWMIECAMK